MVLPFVAAVFLLAPWRGGENRWPEKLDAAVAAAAEKGTVAAYVHALDVAWRADAWQEALRLATAARAKHPAAAELLAPAARAYWRGGHIHESERAAERIDPHADERVALATRLNLLLARGEFAAAEALGERLAGQRGAAAGDLAYVLGARFATGNYAGVVALLERIAKSCDPANGYPETYVHDAIDGLAEYLKAVGTDPFNQIAKFGTAEMTQSIIRLPACMVMINGHGPYRMLVDTGGSITLSIDTEVAEEIGLKSVADAGIHGVAGRDTSGQAVVDEMRLGGITLKRVMTRIFGVRKAAAFLFDGVIGTGMFAEGRMTLDFHNGRLVLAPSSDEPAAGQAVDVRLVGDGKIIVPVTIEGEAAAALVDSGADIVAMSPSRLKRMFPDKPIQALPVGLAAGVGAEGMPTISLAPGADVVFAGRHLSKISGLGLDALDTLLGPMLGIQTDVLIGMSVLCDMRSMTVDYRKCRMWVEWAAVE